jgi:hypothetical protein
VLRATGARQVDLVAHSQGGVASRAYVRCGGGTLVRSITTMDSPQHGVAGYWRPMLDLLDAIPLLRRVVPFGMYELDERSPTFAWLNSGDETPGNVRYTSIYPRDFDGIVSPVSSPALRGARNIVTDGGHGLLHGHLWHLFVNHSGDAVYEDVRAALLAAGSPQRPRAAANAALAGAASTARAHAHAHDKGHQMSG